MKEIVMGLHWSPARQGSHYSTNDLDALCILFDARHQIIEVISPTRPRTATDSVVHTGNSRFGASEWDDERIFVFLNALPDTVTQVTFCVHSASGQSFSRVPGARCHLSDARREQPLATVDLTTVCDDTFLPVFNLRLEGGTWQVLGEQPNSSPAMKSQVLHWHAEHRDVEVTPDA